MQNRKNPAESSGFRRLFRLSAEPAAGAGPAAGRVVRERNPFVRSDRALARSAAANLETRSENALFHEKKTLRTTIFSGGSFLFIMLVISIIILFYSYISEGIGDHLVKLINFVFAHEGGSLHGIPKNALRSVSASVRSDSVRCGKLFRTIAAQPPASKNDEKIIYLPLNL